jgi:hypothetical protein
MNPEELEHLASELGNVMNNNASAPSYIVVWVFLALLGLLVPLLIKLIKTINTNQKIMDLHIDELKYIRDKVDKQEEKIDKLDEKFDKTELKVMKNTTLIGVLKDKC